MGWGAPCTQVHQRCEAGHLLMNIGSSIEDNPYGSGTRLGIIVPLPADYTDEELRYAQDELQRLTYLSMYKIIDEIGQRRENAELAQQTTSQEAASSRTSERQAQWTPAGYKRFPREAHAGHGSPCERDPSGGSCSRPGDRQEASPGEEAPHQEAEAGCCWACTCCNPRSGRSTRIFR